MVAWARAGPRLVPAPHRVIAGRKLFCRPVAIREIANGEDVPSSESSIRPVSIAGVDPHTPTSPAASSIVEDGGGDGPLTHWSPPPAHDSVVSRTRSQSVQYRVRCTFMSRRMRADMTKASHK